MAAVDVVADLATDLALRNQSTVELQRYYDGDHPMAYVHRKVATRYARLLTQAVSNFPLLIIDSVADRLTVQGFRIDDSDADQFVWRELWQRNDLDIFSAMIHQQALVSGISYVSVWPDEAGRARIRGESSMEVIHDVDPADPLRVRQAMKVWADVKRKTWNARVFEPGTVTFLSAEYRGVDTHTQPDMATFAEFAKGARWTVEQVVDNPFGETIPIVPFLNRPRMNGTGFSEIADILPIFDRINTLTADLLLAAELAAFKIRWATGLAIPTDDAGNQVEPFDVALDRLWVSEDPETKFGSFDASPLEPYQVAIDQAIQQAAAVSRTPPFLLLGKLTNLSAEALKATESGLVQKVKNRMRVYGSSWEQVIRLGLTVYGDPRSELLDMEVIWADPENVSEAARVDALTKLSNIGLPWGAIMERWGASPQEIARWDEMRADDTFNRLMQTTQVPAPGLMSISPQPETAQANDGGDAEQ